ncbi:PQ-loop-domain-containing protein [Cylindrobasidium torrendii FP15055 ss-10]|uniref:PQ-loop-domain-containing protein n=1 Tax=Cylindrobasidium torrendii FP15055 ss-10 TaxID=1314674 RepID=A0A0D7BM27_9AGAR|nr:PQ-loop-domain-containing protein [Cylindrobasidium torrendii FP15055 ss-10]
MSTGDVLSSIFGWVSLASWIIVYSPQIYENYALQSGEGLSIVFVYIWLLGDLCNLVGAGLAGLLPTVIILAVYYTVCDVTLLVQVYYYRGKAARKASNEGLRNGDSEETPLINGNSRAQEETPIRTIILRYVGAVLFICFVGIFAWGISSTAGSDGGDEAEDSPQDEKMSTKLKWTVQILGWSSALLYLGARIPQIAKNVHTRCEGLAPGLFFFAIFGNLTYALSICAKSTDVDYLVVNGSWLAGSTLTILLDIIVLGQFFYYRTLRTSAHVVEVESS